ncbi:MAG: hypothetical protein L0Y71_03080, partial [Gemmataceae bacterium]|nr:hypothetical protein [Gemmataceae bacterium]
YTWRSNQGRGNSGHSYGKSRPIKTLDGSRAKRLSPFVWNVGDGTSSPIMMLAPACGAGWLRI